MFLDGDERTSTITELKQKNETNKFVKKIQHTTILNEKYLYLYI